jgi:hypothetical protein
VLQSLELDANYLDFTVSTPNVCCDNNILLILRKNGKNIGYSQWRTQEFFRGWGVSTNSFEDRGQKEQGSRGGSPLVRGSNRFANE